MKKFHDLNITQWIGYLLILISLVMSVVVVYQEMTTNIYGSDDGGLINQEILQPLQAKESLPNLVDQSSPVDKVDLTRSPTPIFQSTAAAIVEPEMFVPDQIVINAIYLFAPIIPVHFHDVNIEGQDFLEWEVPEERVVGWHDTSAMLGQLGNIVLNGHHNAFGMVFAKLVDLKEGDLIIISSGTREYKYEVDKVMVIREEGLPNKVRIQNASWINPTPDERLTLVTCWPSGDNTHRVIVVATPAGD
jgi:LPXTG-site transpeptidase (sortase) family protein